MITALSTGNYIAHALGMNNTLGPELRRLREERGLTQTQLAEQTGIARAHLSQIEAGKIATPNADTRRRLADALGVSHLDLLVAAGEITREEIRAAGAEGVVERRGDDLASRLHDAIDSVHWETKAGQGEGLLRMIAGIRQDQTRERERAGRGGRKSLA